MHDLIQRYPVNTLGQDYIIGDIHGHFTRVWRVLEKINFDPKKDRLFSVGDLIDRGPECPAVLWWLAQPWFHAVRGNHEDFVIRYQTVDPINWIANGGAWFLDVPEDMWSTYADRLAELPFAMEIETDAGVVGVCHADCPDDWNLFANILESKKGRDLCMWNRSRIQLSKDNGVRNIRAVIVGHTPLREPLTLGNVMHIDTGGWIGVEGGAYKFTIINAGTLQVVEH